MNKLRNILYFLTVILALQYSFLAREHLLHRKSVYWILLTNVPTIYVISNLIHHYKEALLAIIMQTEYDQGKAEAYNNLGFCAFMRMDFDAAENYYKKVYKLTQNELELVIADIGLMKIYQRTSMNKEYYDCRNSAVRRMKRIDEDQSVFVDVHDKKRLNYARSEFFIVSSIYYFYLQQQSEAIQSINQVQDSDLASDTAQILYYDYIKGSAELFEKKMLSRIILQNLMNSSSAGI